MYNFTSGGGVPQCNCLQHCMSRPNIWKFTHRYTLYFINCLWRGSVMVVLGPPTLHLMSCGQKKFGDHNI